jgi:hypothetical protein
VLGTVPPPTHHEHDTFDPVPGHHHATPCPKTPPSLPIPFCHPEFPLADPTLNEDRHVSLFRTEVPLPPIKFDTISQYTHTAETAPRRRTNLIFEVMEKDYSLSNQFLLSTGITALLVLPKDGSGICLQNRSSAKLHFEATQEFYRDSRFPGNSVPRLTCPSDCCPLVYTDEHGNCLFACLGESRFSWSHRLQLVGLFRDLLLRENCKVPSLDPIRNNRGPTLGFAGNQGNLRQQDESVAHPRPSAGTGRYSNVFAEASHITREIVQSSGWGEQFFNPSTDPPGLVEYYTGQTGVIAPGNVYAIMSCKLYIHDHSHTFESSALLSAHRDKENPVESLSVDWMLSAWHTWFELRLNRFVTGTLIFAGRKSLVDAYNRTSLLQVTGARVMNFFNSSSPSYKQVTVQSLCPPHLEYTTSPANFIQSLHSLTPVDYIIRANKILNGLLSRYFALEVLFCFHVTNNSLRFHRFMTKEVFPLLEQDPTSNRWSSVPSPSSSSLIAQPLPILFQRWLFKNFGSWTGTLDRSKLQEGCTRYQTGALAPVSHYATENMLNLWVSLGHSHNRQEDDDVSVTLTDYKSLIGKIETTIHGAGKLIGQKLLQCDAALGICFSSAWLGHWLSGSDQHFKQLKQPPDCFVRKEQVGQLVTYLSVLHSKPRDEIDEMICTYVKNHGKQGIAIQSTVGTTQQQAEVWYRGHSPCIVQQNKPEEGGSYVLKRLVSGTGLWEDVNMKSFHDPLIHPGSVHYIPPWVSGPTQSNLVSFATTQNFTFGSKKNESPAKKIRPLTMKTVNNCSSYLQSLFLNPKRYLAILDPFEFVSGVLGIEPKHMAAAISVTQGLNRIGYLPKFNSSAISLSRPNQPPEQRDPQIYTQILDLQPSFRPRVGLVVGRNMPWAYQTPGLAKLALLLHLLVHTKIRGKDHWVLDYLLSINELVILVPVSDSKDIGRAVFYLWAEPPGGKTWKPSLPRDGQHKVFCRMISDDGSLQDMFEVCGFNSS